MKSVKKFFLWFGLLNKRLLKKISFLLILCSIPLLVVAVNLMSKQEGGILNIVVYAEDSEDELAQEIIDSLLSGEDIINYMEAESADEAGKLVQSGRADAAWIFPEGFQDEVDNYLKKGYLEEGIIQVVEKEDNVMLHLSREVLFGKLYSSLSYLVYERFVTEDLLRRKIFLRNSCEAGFRQQTVRRVCLYLAIWMVKWRIRSFPICYIRFAVCWHW